MSAPLCALILKNAHKLVEVLFLSFLVAEENVYKRPDAEGNPAQKQFCYAETYVADNETVDTQSAKEDGKQYNGYGIM